MKSKLTDTTVEVFCPIEENTTGVKSVIINPDTQEVIWQYCYFNGEKRCYGYQIKNKLKNKTVSFDK